MRTLRTLAPLELEFECTNRLSVLYMAMFKRRTLEIFFYIIFTFVFAKCSIDQSITSYGSHSIGLQCESVDCFLCDLDSVTEVDSALFI